MEIELIPVSEAAQRSGVHVDTLYAAIKDGRLDFADCEGKKMLFADQIRLFRPAKRGRKPAQAQSEGDNNAD